MTTNTTPLSDTSCAKMAFRGGIIEMPTVSRESKPCPAGCPGSENHIHHTILHYIYITPGPVREGWGTEVSHIGWGMNFLDWLAHLECEDRIATITTDSILTSHEALRWHHLAKLIRVDLGWKFIMVIEQGATSSYQTSDVGIVIMVSFQISDLGWFGPSSLPG